MARMVSMAAVFAVAAAMAGSATAGEALKAAPASLDPAKAYLLVTANDFGVLAPHPTLVISAYDAKAKDIPGKPGSAAGPLAPGVDYGAYVSHRVFVAREARARTHLVAMAPGDYVIEGIVMETGPQTSFALGSYWFTLKPGVVTDLGEAAVTIDFPEGTSFTSDMLKSAFVPFSSVKARPFALALKPNEARAVAAVGALAREPVILKVGATFGNYMNGPLNKIDRPVPAP